MASIVIHTPKRTWKVRERGELSKVFEKELEKNVAKAVFPKLIEGVRLTMNDKIYLLATFFQRVVARTPLDEDYAWEEIDEYGQVHHYFHKSDDSQCKWSWYMTTGRKRLEYTSEDESLFRVVSDESAIQKIAQDIQNTFNSRKTGKLPEIYNDNEHFDVLEYGGGWGWGNGSPIKEVNGRKHGVERMHSAQAPAGMWRITYAEYERAKQNKRAKTSLIARFGGKKHGMVLTPSDRDLEQMVKLLKKRHIKYGDISKYL